MLLRTRLGPRRDRRGLPLQSGVLLLVFSQETGVVSGAVGADKVRGGFSGDRVWFGKRKAGFQMLAHRFGEGCKVGSLVRFLWWGPLCAR